VTSKPISPARVAEDTSAVEPIVHLPNDERAPAYRSAMASLTRHLTRHLSRREWRPRLAFVAVAVLVIGMAGGCTTDDPKAEPTTTSTTSTPAKERSTASGSAYEVEDLSLRFELPANFERADDNDFVFLARSLDPRAIFSVDRGSPSDSASASRPGETTTPTSLGEVDAVVVTDAAVEGLPAGIAANELVVSNGERSFSVIMSAAPTDLAELWEPFVASVRVDPA
jgi:hypothetical protein